MQDRCEIARWQLGVTEAEQKESPIAAFGNTVAKEKKKRKEKTDVHLIIAPIHADIHTQICTETPDRIQAMEQKKEKQKKKLSF